MLSPLTRRHLLADRAEGAGENAPAHAALQALSAVVGTVFESLITAHAVEAARDARAPALGPPPCPVFLAGALLWQGS